MAVSPRCCALAVICIAAALAVVLMQGGGTSAAMVAHTAVVDELRTQLPVASAHRSPDETEQAATPADAPATTVAPSTTAVIARPPEKFAATAAPSPTDGGPSWSWAEHAPGAEANLEALRKHTFADLEPVSKESIPDLPTVLATFPVPDPNDDGSRDTTSYLTAHTRLAKEGTFDLWKYTLWDEACDVYWTNECFGEHGSTAGFTKVLKQHIFSTADTKVGASRYPVVCMSNLQVLRFTAHVLPAMHTELSTRRAAGDTNKYGFVMFMACHDAPPKGVTSDWLGQHVKQRGKYGFGASNPAFEYLQRSPLLIHAFATNLDERLVAPSGVEKGSAVPLGLDFHSEGGQLSAKDQSRRLHASPKRPLAEREAKVIVDFAVYREGAVSPLLPRHLFYARQHAMGHYSNQPWFRHLRADKSTLYREYGELAFVLSPPGHGYECHRTFEALYRGAIAIVVKGRIQHEAYAGLPVIVLDDVVPNGLSEARLKMWLREGIERQRRGAFDMARLDVRYWVNRIRVAGASRTAPPTPAALREGGVPSAASIADAATP